MKVINTLIYLKAMFTMDIELQFDTILGTRTHNTAT